jgi:prepilin-type N-terminal cleavage/methylation domain-containing protein
MMKRSDKFRAQGFSLIELLIALGILLVITTFVINAFTSGLRTLRRETGLAERDAQVKRVIELMSIELGQAGVTPDLLDPNVINPFGTGSTLSANPSGSTTVSIATSTGVNGASVRGLYPGREIIFELPESAPTSEINQVATVPACASTTCNITIVNAAQTHAAGSAISSPALPNMFGILNPPPLTGSNLPLTTTTKTVSRIGFVGDILGDGNIQYVEYTYDATSQRIWRSITPITSAAKATAYPILDNVVNTAQNPTGFTLIYPSVNVPIPTAVKIQISAQSSVPEPRLTGGGTTANTFKVVTAETEVTPSGTASAAFIFSNNGEAQLRAMMPPCTAANSGYPPCAQWNSAPWPWWQNIVSNYTVKDYAGGNSYAPIILP